MVDYEDLVLAHPCLEHYWPADESSGNLVDRKGSWDLSPAVDGSYPQYDAAGPFSGLPGATAVANDGTYGPVGTESRFEYSMGVAPSFWTGSSPSTIEAWVYMTNYATTGEARIFTGPLLFYVWNAEFQLVFQRGSAYVDDTVPFPLNSWQYIVGVYDGTNLLLYRNGLLVASGLGSGSYDSDGVALLNTLLGSIFWGPWRGRAAQVALYSCALTAGDVATHFVGRVGSGAYTIATIG